MDLRETRLAEVCVNAIKNGPDWTPAKQNGHIVAAYRIQPVTFTLQEQTTDKKIIKEGDKIIIHLLRDEKHEMIVKIPINNDGRIYYKGEYLMVKGLSFEDAKVLITNQYQKLSPESKITKIELYHS